MKTIITIFASALLLACTSQPESLIEADEMYYVIRGENNNYSTIISEIIENKINGLEETESSRLNIVEYDLLTKKYIKFLNDTEDKFASNDNVFFKDGVLTEQGKDYLQTTKLYSSKIIKLAPSKELKDKINFSISPRDIRKDSQEGEIYVYHMDYFFNQLKAQGIITYLSDRRKNVLDIENDFINDKICRKNQ
ncbi:hypothetical protein [Flavobacterium selenitireducens]|uniref:hypothetical protein n=1 Tax=Flavobacterium selenitireducens TaxID=2722704 RepID=UPI00168BB82A|nr:hypothetical protein [Flavobacterium selenitireducens]MBD3584090.1 hypothetical protein [Flavobacterium selenitireducens]